MFYNRSFEVISESDLYSLCKAFERVIIKPARNTSGSKGISFWHNREPLDKLLACFDTYSEYVIQECIEQHEEMSSLHPESTNTVRVMSLNYKGEVETLSSILRIGVNGSAVDNFTVGGIAVGIEESGKLKDCAFDVSGKKYTEHPQGASFPDHFVPNFHEITHLCKALAPRFTFASRLISWDFAIGKDGHPTLIEVNLGCGGFDFHQLCNGPVFGDFAKEILQEIFTNKRNILYRRFFDGLSK